MLQRMARLFLNEKRWLGSSRLLEHSQILPGKLVAQLEACRDESLDKGTRLIRDILASVPYFLEADHGIPHVSARYLIWPLTHVGGSELCSPEVRSYVLERLWILGKTSKWAQASQAAKMLEESIPREDWLHLHYAS